MEKSARHHRRAMRRLGFFEPLEHRVLLAGDITTGLVHYWTFDETSGDTAHDSAGTSDGTLVNWAPTEPKWEPGRVGGALRFDTPDNAVLVTQPPPMSGSYAVSFWLNVTDRTGVNPRVFQTRVGNDIFVNIENNRSVGFSSNNTNTFEPDPPTFNTWEHYAINFNAATQQGVIYRSGAPVGIGSYVDSASISTWFIGHSFDLSNTNNSLKGALDDLRVYDRLLADEDIGQLASLGIPEPFHQEPVHHWTFDETTGFTAHDIAGGADGVLLNWNQTEPRWEAGKVGGALRFSTADNALVTSSVSTGAQWSIAFWLKLEARTGINPRILEPWAYINQENNRGVGFTSRNVDTFDSTPVALDKWEHYTITYDTILDVGTIYRNGVTVKSGFFGDNSPASAWVFGHQSGDLGNHGDSLDGLLDDFRHYDRLLSTTEIQQLALAAVNDEYSTNEDIPLAVDAAHGVLANDGNANAGSKATVGTDAAHGNLLLNENGSFTYEPDDDYNGPDSFTYRLTDRQGNFALATVALTVKPVNDAPIFTKGADQAVTYASGPQSIPGWATKFAPGPPTAIDEANQKLTFIVTNVSNSLFTVQPAIDPSGKLTFTPGANVAGTAHVTVKLMDDGGTANGGVDTSAPQTFDIVVTKPHPWHNDVNPLGVVLCPPGEQAVCLIAPNAPLAAINFINAYGSSAVPANAAIGQPFGFIDTTDDNSIAPDDVLALINAINALGASEGEPSGGEGEASIAAAVPSSASSPTPLNDLIALLAVDVAWQPKRRLM